MKKLSKCTQMDFSNKILQSLIEIFCHVSVNTHNVNKIILKISYHGFAVICMHKRYWILKFGVFCVYLK